MSFEANKGRRGAGTRAHNGLGATLPGLSLALACAASALAVPAMAGPDDNSLNVAWGVGGPIENVDNYFNTNRSGIWFSRMVWDQLIYREPKTYEYQPLLATSWELMDGNVWRFKLREGVKFHNGEPFDADDVVFTLNWISDPANGVKVQQNVAWIDRAEKVDQYTVDLYMKAVFPQALEYLSGPITIYPNEYYSEAGPEGMHNAPVGTGPMRVVSVKTAEEYVLEKNTDYTWGGPKGEAQVDRMVVREIPDVQTQIAELFSGGVDITGDITADHVEQISGVPGYDAMQAGTMRVGYIGFDLLGGSGSEPLQSLEVRMAIAMAVNRESLVKNLIRGDAVVLHTPCYHTQFGCDQSVATKWEYNPEKAKELLAEAGYADGFKVDLYTMRPAAWSEAVMADLAKIGIEVTFNSLPYFALRDKIRDEGNVPMFFMDYGSYSMNDVSAITSYFFRGSSDDTVKDEELAGWLEEGDTSMDPEIRKAAYSKAIAKITEQVYWLPMFNHVRNYAFDERLNFIPYEDEVMRFWKYGWKQD